MKNKIIVFYDKEQLLFRYFDLDTKKVSFTWSWNDVEEKVIKMVELLKKYQIVMYIDESGITYDLGIGIGKKQSIMVSEWSKDLINQYHQYLRIRYIGCSEFELYSLDNDKEVMIEKYGDADSLLEVLIATQGVIKEIKI